ncbi:MAG TPA: hypothetical protein VIL71_22145 [Spirillospora sp.]|mgnify:CR=1 FL=1
MRQNRSADPWSAFLNARRPDPDARSSRPGPAPGEPGAEPPGGHGSDEVSRRVLAQLRDADGPMTLEQLHHATRLGLVEVAGAVDALRERGLVSVERETDEVVRLTGR